MGCFFYSLFNFVASHVGIPLVIANVYGLLFGGIKELCLSQLWYLLLVSIVKA